MKSVVLHFKELKLKITHSHSGEKPYSYEVYGSTFTVCSNLETHVQAHTGE